MSYHAHTQLLAFVYTDIVGSSDIKLSHGSDAYLQFVLEPHDQIFRQVLSGLPGSAEIQKPGAKEKDHPGDGFLAYFSSVRDAVFAALRFQQDLQSYDWTLLQPQVRVGVHMGELIVKIDSEGRITLSGHALDMGARVMSLARGKQVLTSQLLADTARVEVRDFTSSQGQNASIRWHAHGQYLLKGNGDEAVPIVEAGIDGISPFTAPAEGPSARRLVQANEEELLGWRPAIGEPVPDRTDWIIEAKLGEGGFGEVWIARNKSTHKPLVFKFCFDAVRLRSFKRELAFFERLRKDLKNASDIVQLVEFHDQSPPYYLVSEYVEGGNLVEWFGSHGKSLRIADKVGLVASISRTVHRAHSVGVIHRDIKPENILISIDSSGKAMPVLADFGIGAFADRSQDNAPPGSGFSQSLPSPSEHAIVATRMYAPPEAQVPDNPATTSHDIYALGILLYQLLVNNLRRHATVGCEREIRDPVLRDDIRACLEGDPLKRLSSAQTLAERLERLSTRRRQWYLKRIARIAFILAIVIAVLGVYSWVQFQRVQLANIQIAKERSLAINERAIATREATRARAVQRFLASILTSADLNRPGGSPDSRIIDVVRRSEGIIKQYENEAPEVRAAIHTAVGRVYAGMAEYEKAEVHLSAANRIRSAPDFKLDKYERAEQADTLATLAMVTWWRHGNARFTETNEYFDRAIDLRELDAKDMESHGKLLDSLGIKVMLLGQPRDTERLRKLGLRWLWPGQPDEVIQRTLDLAFAALDEARAIGDQNKVQSIIESFLNSGGAPTGEMTDYLPLDVALMAAAEAREGRFERAEALCEASLAMADRNPNAVAVRHAINYIYIRDCLLPQAKWRQSLEFVASILDSMTQRMGRWHWHVLQMRLLQAFLYDKLGEHMNAEERRVEIETDLASLANPSKELVANIHQQIRAMREGTFSLSNHLFRTIP